MTQKEVAIQCMKNFDIYKPYIKAFEKNGTITLFERFGGYYIDEHNEPELLKQIKEFEAEYLNILKTSNLQSVKKHTNVIIPQIKPLIAPSKQPASG